MAWGSTLETGSPKLTSLWSASIAQPVGSHAASVCIQSGVISIGHQQPPRAASRLAAPTPIPPAWPCVRASTPR